MNQVILEITNLSKSYDDFDVLKSISFHVEKGKCFGVLGPNGAGKTTLFSIISGILDKNEGEISINGESISHDAQLKHGKIGILFNEIGIYEKLTAREFLTFLGVMYDLPEEKVEERIRYIADILQLDLSNKTLIEKYSTGMKKKIAFAAAIIHSPDLLLLDEPFESVDAIVTHNIKELIRSYIEEGGTILIASHILQIIEEICDDFIIIDKGKVLLKSNVNELNGNNLEQYFVDIISNQEVADAKAN
ncbi:ABC transporter ATP-binding protein [Neobacillus sp. OS1-2]|uniref:ABC transporter ATP-binding protein n=1 Tax=Neobacillus sp. OS1-2 TaxID=3070680 RepID=UPI0027E09F0A|nr:ABC transporter ATP-binding protein [Neobacillus sp. OS1-2]WML41614.1 ABC transporter ATP-binding protein [Neobacillus sp. OS1-2]